MRKLKNVSGLIYLSLAVMVFAFVSCDKDDEGKRDLKFTPSDQVEVVVGVPTTVDVSGGVAPYTVESSDDKIATATVEGSKINIKGVAEGTAAIAVFDKDKNSGKITVTVKEAEGLTFDKDAVEVAAEEEVVVTVSNGTAPYVATPKDEGIATATIEDSKITIKGVKAGETEIEVTDKDEEKRGTIAVTVK